MNRTPPRAVVFVFFLVFFAATGAVIAQEPPDPDRDGDGLSDFHERHKHLTDPAKKDSDGDGVPDGEWTERREAAYTVRTLVQVMRPVTPEFLTDDWQDARVIEATPEYVELEVIHYPFSTAGDGIARNPEWRSEAARLKAWLRPGPTADVDEAFRKEIAAALREEGIDPGKLDDRTLVEKASASLLKRAAYEDGFTTFVTGFDAGGRPFAPPDLAEALERGRLAASRDLKDQWEREISAKGMFRRKTRGSCTSSAIYLNGCLRALGLPSRIVLGIPAADANDPYEMAMAERNLRHHGVRRAVRKALEEGKGKWSSHTFNEVWVGGRWRRLNYHHLGQGILDENFLGLMTHVATFDDWADARMWETVGRRQGLHRQDDVFGGPNPYSCLFIADRFGPRAKVENPAPADEALELAIVSLRWSDDSRFDEEVRKSLGENDGFFLLAEVKDWGPWERFKKFTVDADGRFYLEAPGQPTLSIASGTGGLTEGSKCWAMLGLGPADRRDLRPGVAYTLRPRNGKPPHRWAIADNLQVVRDP